MKLWQRRLGDIPGTYQQRHLNPNNRQTLLAGKCICIHCTSAIRKSYTCCLLPVLTYVMGVLVRCSISLTQCLPTSARNLIWPTDFLTTCTESRHIVLVSNPAPCSIWFHFLLVQNFLLIYEMVLLPVINKCKFPCWHRASNTQTDQVPFLGGVFEKHVWVWGVPTYFRVAITKCPVDDEACLPALDVGA